LRGFEGGVAFEHRPELGEQNVGIHLATLPRSGDRTCLRQLSPLKWEFLQFGLEIVGIFSSGLPNLTDKRLWTNTRIVYKIRYIQQLCDHSLWLSDWLAGAKGFEPRYGELEVRRSRRSRGAPEPPLVEIHKFLETFEFREPYRFFGVQSFGE